jgi:pyruvate kinase
MIARYRPRCPIIVLTPQESTFMKMRLVYGCEPVIVKPVKDIEKARHLAKDTIAKLGFGKSGDTYILGAGVPFGSKGSTNLMLIDKI